MSVWDNPCYAIDPLWRTIRNLPKSNDLEYSSEFDTLCDFRIDNSSHFAIESKGLLLSEIFKRSPRDWRNFVTEANRGKQIIKKGERIFRNAFAEIRPDFTGIKAVYWAFANIWREKWRFWNEVDFDEYEYFNKELWKISPNASRLKASAWIESAQEINIGRDDFWKHLINTSVAIDHIWILQTRLRYQKIVKKYTTEDQVVKYPYITAPNQFGNLEITKFNGGYFLRDKKSKKVGLYYWKDHVRLMQMVKSAAKMYVYYSAYQVDKFPKLMQSCFMDVMEEICISMIRLDKDGCNKLCRSLDVLQFEYMASIANDIWTKSIDDQAAKIKRERLDEIFNMDVYRLIFRNENLGDLEILELLKIYKFLPCPDFDHYSVVNNLKDKFENPNEFNIDQSWRLNNGMTLSITTDEVMRYMKRSKIRMFHERHHRLPGRLISIDDCPTELIGYPNIDWTAVTLENVHHIDISNSFQYRTYDDCEYELVKDKKTALRDSREQPNFYEDNQVLQFLYDPNFVSQAKIRQVYDDCHEKGTFETPWENVIEVALKPEAKKPSSRAFFMANDPNRRMLSEFEANVSNYVEHKPGSSQGADDKALGEKLSEITNWMEDSHRPFMISFDIEAFSPKQNIELKRLGLKQWAEVFGMKSIEQIENIFTKSKVRWKRFDVNEEFDIPGNDMEGFHGRMNTDLHVDIMGYCVKKCRDLGLLDSGGKFACLIDDGILSLQVHYKKFASTCKQILEVIEKIYSAFSLKISWDKTFASEYFMQYLNKVYIDGREMMMGIKSFLRIAKPKMFPVPEFRQEMEALTSSVRGAIKAGTDHRLAYSEYISEFYFLLKRWSKWSTSFKVTGSLISMCIVPESFGGYGLSSLFSLSSNETFDSVVAGLAAMKFLSHAYPELRDFYSNLLKVPINDMSIDSILRNPRSVSLGLFKINPRRFANATKNKLVSNVVNPFLKLVAAKSKHSYISPSKMVMSQSDLMHEFTRSRLWMVDPNNVIESLIGKLQNSSTATLIVGRWKVANMTVKNRTEAQKFILNSVHNNYC